jgi:lathosterol oxidase
MADNATQAASPIASLIDSLTDFDFGTENPYRVFNKWVNSFFFSDAFVKAIENKLNNEEASYYLVCYFRDFIAGSAVYWITGSVWHFFIYTMYGEEIFTKNGRPFPSSATLKHQMTLSQLAIFVYASLPVLSEYIIESGYTKTYFYISDIGGWQNYFKWLFVYVCCFEIGIYWAHRKLHTVKFLYKYLHSTHHQYNKWETMTPWASIAFNPFDGMLQAASYLLFLPVVPVHYFTHIFLLFFSGIWATNIHDSVPMNSEPLMGAAYHAIHHTHYHYNFGQWFIFCDYLFGTLRSRQDLEDMRAAAEEAKKSK